jgi:hypothetical protein
MQLSTQEFEAAFSSFLGALWDELEDLIDTYYDGSGGAGAIDLDRLRLKLEGLRQRLDVLLAKLEPWVDPAGPFNARAARLHAFGVELLRMLDFDLQDDAFDLSCGPTMVRAQNRIVDEAQRLARAC